MKKFLLTLIAVLALIPAALVVTQAQQGPTIEISGVNPTELPIINITAVVLDIRGQPVSGLTAENFRLSGELADRAEIIRVSSVTDQNLPVSVVLAIDVSTSMSGAPIQNAREAARLFVESIGPNDPVAIVVFSNDARVVQDFTSDKDVLLQAIDALPVGGETQLYEGALVAAELAAEAPTPRRAVILLSDGAQYTSTGVASVPRPAAFEETIRRGVPIYTIGLGFGTDRTYLEGIATYSNGQFLESPVPEELPALYEALALRLRTQYEIILRALDLPPDGTVYDFELEVETDEGTAQSEPAQVRVPVPVPVIRITPIEAVVEAPVEVVAEITADDDLTTVEFLLDDVVVSTETQEPYSFLIDPLVLAPGLHTLGVSATDVDGDTGTASLEFEVAALPSTVTISTEIPSQPLNQPLEVTLSISGQTPATAASYALDSDPLTPLDTQSPTFTIDPLNLAPGDHTLTIVVTNEGGATTTVERTFSVADLPPTFEVRGLENNQVLESSAEVLVDIRTSQTPVTDLTFALNGEIVDNAGRAPGALILEAFNLPPGPSTLDVTVTNEGGQSSTQSIGFTVAALPPQVTVTGLAAGETIEEDVTLSLVVESQTPVSIVNYHLDGLIIQPDDPFTLPLEVLALRPGAHILNIAVTNEGGQTFSLDIAFMVSEGPSLTATALAPTSTPTITPTFTPSHTPTTDLTATVVIEQATADAAASATAILEATTVAEAQATSAQQLLGTQSAQAASVRATLNARSTETQQARDDEPGTVTDEPVTEVMATDVVDTTATAESQALEAAQGTATQEAINAQATTDAIQVATEQQATVDAEALAVLEATANAQATEIMELEMATATSDVLTATADAFTAMLNVTASATAATAQAQAEVSAQGTADAQATADALSTTMAESTSAAQAVVDAQATRDAEANATISAEGTLNAQATDSAANAQATENAQATVTADAQATLTADAQATANAQATENAQATVMADAQATLTADAQATANAQATENAKATEHAQATADSVVPTATATETETVEPTVTEEEESTAVAQLQSSPTPTPAPAEATPTPTVTATLIPAQAEAPAQGDNLLPILLVIGGAILLLVLVFLLLSRARRSDNRTRR